MKLTPSRRITMIKECATLLDKEGYTDIDLVLQQHSLPTSDVYSGEGARGYVIDMIKDADDEQLALLHAYLVEGAGSRNAGDSPFSGDQVRVFFSHLTGHRVLVGQVADAAARFGVQAFVAHDSIEPSREWQGVIEAGLSECDALVVFLHDGFGASRWCDQEVGWVMGRHRPVLPLWFDVAPYGFMGKLQAKKIGRMQAHQLGGTIVDWLITQPALHSRLAPGVAQAFASSRSFDFTRKVAGMLGQLQSIDDASLDVLDAAVLENDQISKAVIEDKSGPEWVRDFTAARRPPSSTTTTSWEDVPF